MRKSICRRLVRSGAMACCLVTATAAAAQDAGQVLVPGANVTGEVAGDPFTIPLQIEPGKAVRLDAIPGPDESNALDLFLRVLDPAGNLVGENDDNEGTVNPRLEVVSAAGGRYSVEVGAYSSGQFSLIARSSNPKVPTALDWSGGPLERAIEFPKEQGALFTIVLPDDGSYDVSLAPVADGGADPVLDVFSGEDFTVEPTYHDDDSLGNLGSRVVADVAAGPTTFTIRVSNLAAGGGATLKVARIRDQVVTPRELAFDSTGEPVEFTDASPVILEDAGRRFAPYALFRFPPASTLAALAQAGRQLTVRAESTDLDPYLEVGFVSPFGFSAVRSNDDTAGSANAVIVLDPAVLLNAQPSEDPEGWWKQLRIRVSAPQGARGTMQVTASTGENTKGG